MLTTLAFTTALLATTQDPMMSPIPKTELSAISFLTGGFKGTGTASDPTGAVIKTTGTSSAKIEFDRWLNIHSVFNMGPHSKLEGRMLLTYNSTKKQYEGTWFDNMSDTALAARGYTEGKYLVLFSDEFEMTPGQKTFFKIVYSKESARSYKFSMKMKAGDQWLPMMTMDYKR